jgi:hypothetical protein
LAIQQFILRLIVSSVFLSVGALKQEKAYAQNSPTTTTNATTISDADNSQSGLQSKSVNYYDNSSGYLVYPATTITSNTTTAAETQKLPAVGMIHKWWWYSRL